MYILARNIFVTMLLLMASNTLNAHETNHHDANKVKVVHTSSPTTAHVTHVYHKKHRYKNRSHYRYRNGSSYRYKYKPYRYYGNRNYRRGYRYGYKRYGYRTKRHGYRNRSYKRSYRRSYAY